MPWLMLLPIIVEDGVPYGQMLLPIIYHFNVVVPSYHLATTSATIKLNMQCSVTPTTVMKRAITSAK